MATEQQPILLLAETGLIIRNLLLGTFAETVAARRPLVVAVQNPQDERLLNVVRGKAITLIPFLHEPVKQSASHSEMLFSWQTYMYRFKQSEKGTKAIENSTRLFEPKHSPAGKASIKFLIGTGHLLKRVGLMARVEDAYLNSLARKPITKQWGEVLDRISPAIVVSTKLSHATMRGANADLPVVVAAHGRGIPCGTLVQSWDNLSSKTAVLPSWLDRYWTWSETMSRELLALTARIPAARVKVVGSPQFDFHVRQDFVEPRETYLRQLGLDPLRPYILIGTGTRKRTPNESHTVIRLIRQLRERLPHCQALIRLHPKDDGKRWRNFESELTELGAVVQQTAPALHMDLGGFVSTREFYRDQINSITHAAAVINTSSTLTVDAALLDRPVICLGYDVVPDKKFPEGRAWAFTQSTHYAPLVATGGVTIVRSEAECLDAIDAYLKNSRLHEAGRREIVNLVTGVADGGAGERLAEEVLTLAERSATSVETESVARLVVASRVS